MASTESNSQRMVQHDSIVHIVNISRKLFSNEVGLHLGVVVIKVTSMKYPIHESSCRSTGRTSGGCKIHWTGNFVLAILGRTGCIFSPYARGINMPRMILKVNISVEKCIESNQSTV